MKNKGNEPKTMTATLQTTELQGKVLVKFKFHRSRSGEFKWKTIVCNMITGEVKTLYRSTAHTFDFGQIKQILNTWGIDLDNYEYDDLGKDGEYLAYVLWTEKTNEKQLEIDANSMKQDKYYFFTHTVDISTGKNINKIQIGKRTYLSQGGFVDSDVIWLNCGTNEDMRSLARFLAADGNESLRQSRLAAYDS